LAVSFNSNIAALKATRQLGLASGKLSDVFTRLASGQRINHASDDAAGLSIASSLDGRTHVYNQAVRNVNDGISYLNIEESALDAFTHILTRQEELATQAANGSLSFLQRRALNDEYNQLVWEYNRIVNSVSFNKQKILNTADSSFRVQAGYGLTGSLSFTISESLARGVGNGTLASGSDVSQSNHTYSVSTGDFNNDRILDLVLGGNAAVHVLRGNGDGTFQSAVSYSTSGSCVDSVSATDVNGDGRLDLVAVDGVQSLHVLLGNGNGTFGAASSYTISAGVYGSRVVMEDFNGDGIKDAAVSDYSSGKVWTMLGNGQGSFTTASYWQAGSDPWDLISADFNNDGKADLATANFGSGTLSIALSNGNGSFQSPSTYSAGGAAALSATDLNGDGIVDLLYNSGSNVAVRLGSGNGNFGAATSYAAGAGVLKIIAQDFTGDGYADALCLGNDSTVKLLTGKGDGTFQTSVSSIAAINDPWSFAAGDFNGDGATDVVSHSELQDYRVNLGNSSRTNTIALDSLYSQGDARDALDVVKATLSRVSLEKGKVGALQSRLTTALANLKVSSENYSAATARIMDADVAQEAAQMVRYQILQNAATAVQAQARQQPALALTLLGGFI